MHVVTNVATYESVVLYRQVYTWRHTAICSATPGINLSVYNGVYDILSLIVRIYT